MNRSELKREVEKILKPFDCEVYDIHHTADLIMELFGMSGEGARGTAPANLLSARSEHGTETDLTRREEVSGAGTKHSVPRALSARQGSAEEEERFVKLEQDFLGSMKRWKAAQEETKYAQGVNCRHQFFECEVMFNRAAYAYASALLERPDETATGERGGVLSAEALTLRDWWDVFAKLNEVHWRYDPSMHSPNEQADEFAESLKRIGYHVSRISGDGTSERRADNVKAQGAEALQKGNYAK